MYQYGASANTSDTYWAKAQHRFQSFISVPLTKFQSQAEVTHFAAESKNANIPAKQVFGVCKRVS